MEREVEAYLRRRHPAAVRGVEVVAREDLDLKNHLSGLQRRLLKARAPLQALLLCRPCRHRPLAAARQTFQHCA
jgi:BMFP domain-containing protein YqiC